MWKQGDIFSLLDSVYKGLPIGSILIWETDDQIESAERIGPITLANPPSGPVGYLLDGQQRITSLFGTLQFPIDDNESIIDQIDWRVYFDLESSEFIRKPGQRGVPKHFPVANLFDTASYLSVARKFEEFADQTQVQYLLSAADRLANAFRNYQLPIIHIREASIDSAVTVFARLNRTGRKISADEMVSALTYRRGEFHLSEKFDVYIEELVKKGFGKLKRVFLLRGVLAALGRDIYAKDWAKLVVQEPIRRQLPEAYESATCGINHALEFLGRLGVTSDRILPYGLQLVLLGEFFRLCSDPSSEKINLLRRWFWVTSFSGWFGNANTTMVVKALHEIRDLAEDKRRNFRIVNLEEQALPFPDRFDGRSARARAFLLYLATLQPLSVTSEQETLKPGELLSSLGVAALGYIIHQPHSADEFGSIPGNRMFIDRNLSGDVFDHLAQLDDETLTRVLPSHGFSEESIQAIRRNNPTELIRSRQDCLIEGEQNFMKERGVALPESKTGMIVADSDTSDTDD